MLRTLVLSSVIVLQIAVGTQAAEVPVWIGMSSPQNGEAEGIYRAVLNDETGALSKPELAAKISNPGFLIVNPAHTRLYTVCNLEDGKPGVAVFEISQDGEKLQLMNTQPIDDGDACHIAVDATGKCLFTAQYGTGTVAVFPLEKDGTIRPRSDLKVHKGSGPNKQRQMEAHPHFVGFDPANKYLFVPDLGVDQVVIYRMDLAGGKIKRVGFGQCPAGSGPRHMKFHPNKKQAYAIGELDLSVNGFNYDAEKHTLTPIQSISTLPKEMQTGGDTGSEICIEPKGKFVYAANRGHNSIAVFSVNPDNGELTFVEHEDVQGKHPRNFNIDPSGKWLLVAGRDSNTISVFGIAPATGALEFTGTTVSSPAPICIAF